MRKRPRRVNANVRLTEIEKAFAQVQLIEGLIKEKEQLINPTHYGLPDLLFGREEGETDEE